VADEPIEEGAANLPDLAIDCVNRIDSQTLVYFLRELHEDFRAPLVLYYLQDLSYKEIADVLAVPLGTVQSRIARAKVQLLRCLTETDRPRAQGK
jgi:RNA polymerase sigma-70 factor (ECF subfamily)